jgi:death-on-curing protein
MIFLKKAEILAMHDRAIAEFGGLPGIRDEAGLESALIAAENRYAYTQADLAGCAATYAYHLCKAHAFFDGNKRIAGAATEVFVIVNGAQLDITNDEFVDFFLGIAAGEISRDEAEIRLRSRIKP